MINTQSVCHSSQLISRLVNCIGEVYLSAELSREVASEHTGDLTVLQSSVACLCVAMHHAQLC